MSKLLALGRKEEFTAHHENPTGRPQAWNETQGERRVKKGGREVRGGDATFQRMREGRWKHVKYPGWIQWDGAPGNLLVAEIQTKVKDHEWQMLQAFIRYLDRHLGEEIESISVYYR